MHDDSSLVEQRVRRALTRIRTSIAAASVPCAVGAAAPQHPPLPSGWALDPRGGGRGGGGRGGGGGLERNGDEPDEPAFEVPALRFEPVRPGDAWGPPWSTTWFSIAARAPGSWSGRRVELWLDLGFDDRQPGFQAEGLLYDAGGLPLRGVHPRNAAVPLHQLGAEPGEDVRVYVEAVAIPAIMGGGRDPDPFRPTALGALATAGSEPLYRFGSATLVLVDEEVWALAHDVELLAGWARELPVGWPRRYELLVGLGRAVDAVDLAGAVAGAGSARAELAGLLAAPAEPSAHLVSAVGHAHIDSAWLWPVAETVRKCARTFSSVTALIEDDPDLVFACSQAQQWDWMRQHHPAVFERMVDAARAGRFVPVGGMWVEADTNVPSGESLVRQLVLGKRFFLEHTGVECEEVWLPDCFGYSAALPQLIRLGGSRWFLTQKLSWNDTNRFPHHSFFWQGIDGTRVFTHFPPVDTYNSELVPAELAHARRNFAEHGRSDRSLVPFGYGDGGGGPTPAMLERARRQADLEGSPRVSVEPPAAFFARAEAGYPDAPVWSGELYLEKHRGTLTSQAGLKREMRRCEHLLHEVELWSTVAWRHGHAPYPHDELDRLWKTVLLAQFHDILPGSSIADVNDEALAALATARAALESLLSSRLSLLAGPGPGIVAFNAAPHARAGVPAHGAAPPVSGDTDPVSCEALAGNRHLLRNGLLEVIVGEHGGVVSLLDRRSGRQLVAPGGRLAALQLHPDYPAAWDAWDVEASYLDGCEELAAGGSVAVETSGPEEVAVTADIVFGRSRATQRLSLRRGEGRLRIDLEVDWHEQDRFLKLAFPLDVHAPRERAEIQFGHLERAISGPTSWDAARYEVSNHRFVHLAEDGEPGFGLALAGDSGYGHDVRHELRAGGGLTTTLRMSLLRGPRFPDPRADAGRHRFGFELWPGASLAGAVRAGYACNLPLRLVAGGSTIAPLLGLEPGTGSTGIVIETVKAADDRSGDIVVRLYECLGGRATGRLRTGFPLRAARVTDLLERSVGDLEIERGGGGGGDGGGGGGGGGGSVIALSLRRFEVLTLRLTPA